MPEVQKPLWMKTLVTRANALAEEMGFDDDQTERFRAFLVNTANEQYQAGNMAGLAWARHADSKVADRPRFRVGRLAV
jgi:hypothetical protein